jgi:hypothetical protein
MEARRAARSPGSRARAPRGANKGPAPGKCGPAWEGTVARRADRSELACRCGDRSRSLGTTGQPSQDANCAHFSPSGTGAQVSGWQMHRSHAYLPSRRVRGGRWGVPRPASAAFCGCRDHTRGGSRDSTEVLGAAAGGMAAAPAATRGVLHPSRYSPTRRRHGPITCGRMLIAIGGRPRATEPGYGGLHATQVQAWAAAGDQKRIRSGPIDVQSPVSAARASRSGRRGAAYTWINQVGLRA